jgi:hypothetical protein
MATLVKPILQMFEQATNLYHAEAAVFSADIKQPLQEVVRPRAQVKLCERGEGSYHQFKYAEPFRLDGIISYESGYTQIAGHKSAKPNHGYSTLTMGVIEGLNVLEMITADRIVARISTDHPVNGQVPSVNFLGTRFENLRIAGHRVEVEPFLEILGDRPDKDRSYFDEEPVLGRLRDQYGNISKRGKSLPAWAQEMFPQDKEPWRKSDTLQCSLVNSVAGVNGGTQTFGHVLDVPDVGKIFLGELTITRTPSPTDPDYYTYNIHLDMIRMKLGCPVEGEGVVLPLDTNGSGGGQGGGTPTT